MNCIALWFGDFDDALLDGQGPGDAANFSESRWNFLLIGTLLVAEKAAVYVWLRNGRPDN